MATPPRPPTDDEILKVWRSGDRRLAVGMLYDRDHRYGFSHCFRILRDQTMAEDVTQNVFIKLETAMSHFSGRSSLRSWLSGIAIHRCIEALRVRQIQVTRHEEEEAAAQVADSAAGPAEAAERRQLLAALEHCLQELDDEVRATILLRFNSGMTYEEMAVPLAVQPAALQARVSRALPRLMECLTRRGFVL